MPVYKYSCVSCVQLCTPPLFLRQTRLMKLITVVYLPSFIVYHYLECLQVSTYLILAFRGLSWLAPLLVPFFTFLTNGLHLWSGAALWGPFVLTKCSSAQFRQNGFVPLSSSYEMWYSSRFHALTHTTHSVSEAPAWGTVPTWNMEQVQPHSCKSMVPCIWRNDCDVQLFIFIPGERGEWTGINELWIHLGWKTANH